MANITYRTMTLTDIPTVYKLGVEAFNIELGREVAYAYSYWTVKAIAEIYEGYGDLALVADLDGEVVGFVLGHPSYEMMEDVGYLEWLAVDKKVRKQGVAQELVERFLDQIQKYNVKRVTADIKADNIASLNLFRQKFGFTDKETILFVEREL